MDEVKAKLIEGQLKGKLVGLWTIEGLIDHGKSAAVFKASKGKNYAAVKIFDDELIERYGDKTQLARIERELTLKGRGHEFMAEIIDGGFDETTKNHFLIMGFVPGQNLKKRLLDIPTEMIGVYVSQLAACAEYLETLELVHRDIKPENIVVKDDFSQITLLDFGVIKPVSEPGITDVEGLHPFIGTLQYSSPEFLLREEDGTLEGWRALTFYQIGGVLHDLIMREALFSGSVDPYGRLVNAVQHNTPTIQSSTVPTYLQDLARMCLLKRAEDRLKLLTWESFRIPKTAASGVPALKERITKRVLVRQAESKPAVAARPDFTKPLIAEIVNFLKEAVRRIRSETDTFPPLGTIVRYPNSSGASVKFDLKESESYLIPTPTTVILTTEVVDADARAVSIDVCAYSSGTPPSELSHRVKFFGGIYDNSRLYSALEETIYRIIDVIQRNAHESASWIHLETNEEISEL